MPSKTEKNHACQWCFRQLARILKSPHNTRAVFPQKKKSLVVQKVHNFFSICPQDQRMRNEKAVNTKKNFNSSKQSLKCCENLFILLCRTWRKYCPLFPLLSNSRGNKTKYYLFWEKNTPKTPQRKKRLNLCCPNLQERKQKHIYSPPQKEKKIVPWKNHTNRGINRGTNRKKMTRFLGKNFKLNFFRESFTRRKL